MSDDHQNRTVKSRNKGIDVKVILERLVISMGGDKEPNQSTNKVQEGESINYHHVQIINHLHKNTNTILVVTLCKVALYMNSMLSDGGNVQKILTNISIDWQYFFQTLNITSHHTDRYLLFFANCCLIMLNVDILMWVYLLRLTLIFFSSICTPTTTYKPQYIHTQTDQCIHREKDQYNPRQFLYFVTAPNITWIFTVIIIRIFS